MPFTIQRRVVGLSFFVAISVIGGAGCPVNEPADPVDRDVSFAGEIQPIFTQKCAGCHSEGGFADNAGIPMRLAAGRSLDSIVNRASVQDATYTLVVPFDAADSLLFLKVSSDAPPVGSTMPLFGELLSSEELGLIRDWIEQGAMDN